MRDLTLRSVNGTNQKFVKLRKLTSGIDGFIYTAEREADHKQVIVKWMYCSRATDDINLEYEWQTHKAITDFYKALPPQKHPLSKVYDLDDDGTPLTAKRMIPRPYASGLAQRNKKNDIFAMAMSRERPVPWHKGFDFADQKSDWTLWVTVFAHKSISRIQYVHYAGYAHNDLHDENVCFTALNAKRDDVLVIDFSRARRLSKSGNESEDSRAADLTKWSCSLANIAGKGIYDADDKVGTALRDYRVRCNPDTELRKALTDFNRYIDKLSPSDRPSYSFMRQIWQNAYTALSGATSVGKAVVPMARHGRK